MRLLTVTRTAIVDCLAFSPDGSRVAAACEKANARVWELGSRKPALTLKGTKDAQFIGFLAGTDTLVISSWNTPATFWDLRAVSSRPLGPEPGYCWDTALSPDGTRVARAEGQIYCRDAADGRTVWQADCSNQSGIQTCVRFDAAGSRLFVIAKHVAARDAATGRELSGFDLTFRRYADLKTADVSPDGRWLALRGADGMQVRDMTDGRLVFEEPSIGYGYALAFTPDGSQLAAGPYEAGGGICFWDVGEWRRGPFLDLGIGTVMALAFSADGLLGAAGGFYGQVAVWDRREKGT
jgi:WD40 repeat protein